MDPFAKDKAAALDAAEKAFVEQCTKPLRDETFESLAMLSLWGNRGDLSLSAGVVEKDKAGTHGLTLVNDARECWEHALGARRNEAGRVRVALVLDNCGAELLADLRLASWLLEQGHDVEIHAKPYPVFVSDAMIKDVDEHLEWLAKRGLCSAVVAARRDKSPRLSLKTHDFWASPLFADEMPADLVAELRTAGLVIFKGDANYRRLTGDGFWHPTTPTSRGFVIDPQLSVLAIRTCKAPVAVGLSVDALTQAEKSHPGKWCLDGSSGMVQWRRPHSP